jgi:ribosome assembly protein RRB1
LRFEDPFVEECEAEEDMDGGGGGDDEEEEEEEEAASQLEVVRSWNPLAAGGEEQLRPGETLEMDPSAYRMHHALTTAEWPALSFDFCRDDELGESRTRFPHTLTAVVGTQADRPENNLLTVMRISDMARMRVETEDDILGEEYDNSGDDGDGESSSDEDDGIDVDPVVEHFSIPHPSGGVNRVRVMPQLSDVVAAWSDAGTVDLHNVGSIRRRFSPSPSQKQPPPPASESVPTKPFFSYAGHSTEGYALDWSTTRRGQMVTGDCHGSIHVWNPRPEGGGYAVQPFYENRSDRDSAGRGPPSVEDLQWSPTESTVFAAAECFGRVSIFDTRAPNRAMLRHTIHAADVNVLSWNRLVTNLLATGGDDGTLAVWDLRHFASPPSSVSGGPEPLARFTPHRTPITSVEWHPTDESMLAATDDVGAYIYDLSVEEDDDAAALAAGGGATDVPPQLLFVHSGSEQFKEVHWHPQITSCLMTTALSGFSVFIPSNL